MNSETLHLKTIINELDLKKKTECLKKRFVIAYNYTYRKIT